MDILTIVLAVVIILIGVLIAILAIGLLVSGIGAILEREFVIGTLFTLMSFLLIAFLLFAGVAAFTPKLNEGVVIERGHQERSCSTYYTKSGDILVPITNCTPAHDYIVIQNGDKEQKIKVGNKEDYNINDYYKEEE